MADQNEIEDGAHEDTGTGGGTEGRTRTATRTRRKRRDPRVTNSRVDRRTAQVRDTLKEVVRWLRLDFAPDAEQLGFVDTVDRDAERIGTGLAGAGERIKFIGEGIDLLFGLTGPIAIVVALGPTVRAAIISARQRMTERQQRRQEEAEALAGRVEEQSEFTPPWPSEEGIPGGDDVPHVEYDPSQA